MISKLKIFYFFLIFSFLNFSYSQNNYNINFQEKIIEITENIQTFEWNQMPEQSFYNNGYFGWIQFYQTPNQDIQDRLKNANLKLIDYISNRIYLFYFPATTSIDFLRAQGVRSIIPIESSYKISKELNYTNLNSWALDGNNIKVTLQFYKNVPLEVVKVELGKMQIKIINEYKDSDLIVLSIPRNSLNNLANLSFVKWIELIIAPSVKDDTRGKSLHRSNSLDSQSSVGSNYTGLGVGVMVRDDGIVGPHIDFQGRLTNTFATGTGQTHGDGVAGIMSGAGNLNPDMRGMAAGSDVYVVNYNSSFLDTPTQNFINNNTVQITNSSYSDGCNGGYTTVTRTVDSQSNNIPALLHVFSAGNSNNTDCGYGAGNQWGNITGGHKQGKNVIATANVYFDGSIVSSSSRGPAHDGRIKPDITANGQNQNSTDENNQYLSFGGTSGAAPGIAGVSAQLYELYASLNSGNHPPAALIKAALLNTTNDYGNIGPDFTFGWGMVNGNRAGKLIQNNRYLNDNVTQGVTKTHSINLPSGTSQVRFMVYWNDPAAAAGVSSAIVNDLDLVVKNPSNISSLPWLLDSTPNAVNLNTPATNGIDRKNNMEQVLINNPVSGNYTIEIKGFNIPMGPQQYFLVYEIITEKLVVTYPNGGEKFTPGTSEAIHWDATNTSQNFVLEYTTNNGNSWNPIATVNSNLRIYSWTVPSTITGNAKIRITSGTNQGQSTNTFSISNTVTGLQITQVCPNTASFSWTALAGAESYDLYMLGEKYMEIVGTSTTNSITIPITNPQNPIWYAIVAKNNSLGWKSRRTNALFYVGGLLNCSLPNDLSLNSIGNTPSNFNFACNTSPVVVSANVSNTGTNDQSNFTMRYQINSQTPVDQIYTGTLNSGQQINFQFSTPVSLSVDGNYQLNVSVINTGDQNVTNNNKTLNFYANTQASPINFTEGFEIGLPPPSWSIINADNNTTWVERTVVIGSNGTTSKVAFIDNYDYNARTQQDIIETKIYDLTNANTANLTFNLAKAQYSTTDSDGLQVEISTDCGLTYSSIYFKDALTLSTVPGYIPSPWTPTLSTNWRTETISLASFLGQKVQIRFININGYGNSTFIDNINIEGVLNVNEIETLNFNMFPNPASNEVSIQFYNNDSNFTEIEICNMLGQLVFDSKIAINDSKKVVIDTSKFSSGMHLVTIKNGNKKQIKKLIVK